jgi:hypothetical protein
MTIPEAELRVAELEAKIRQLMQQLAVAPLTESAWWQEIYGTRISERQSKTRRLGRAYRESLRRKNNRRSARQSRKSVAAREV